MEEESLPQKQGIRKYWLERKTKEARSKGAEKMWAAGAAPGTSAQHAEEELQPREDLG